MKILKIIHGYPPRYNAGSEVYSQTLCQNLSHHHEVQVFTRQENPFLPEYALHQELDPEDARILLNIVNVPPGRLPLFAPSAMDEVFQKVLQSFSPDIVHFGHLSHLSTNLISKVYERKIPIVYTLHDYWILCPRGQFIQRNSLHTLCDTQEDHQCAALCYKGFGSGLTPATDEGHWAQWVKKRQSHLAQIVDKVDLFLAPSRYLMKKFQGIFPKTNTLYMDYGFDLQRLSGRSRQTEEAFTFGYIGTHIPTKGIQDLICAFGNLSGPMRLRIWGQERPETTPFLRDLVKKLPPERQEKIEWMGPYRNPNIVCDVFNKMDVLVVPSIWEENSPLVIHEAQQVRIPIITANKGGMAEYVHHQKNGLLFRFRDVSDLSQKMHDIMQPGLLPALSQKGYLYSPTGDIPDIISHAHSLTTLYEDLLQKKGLSLRQKPGPWRITFDTNPDHCNFRCIMCECFSPYSKEGPVRGAPKRVMDIRLIRRILEDSQGTPLREIIPSTMGEPLLYKNFEEIIRLCQDFNLKLNLTTNGSFPRLGAQKWAELLMPVLSDIKISWNGASPKTHEDIMRYSSWDHVMENLKTFLSYREHYSSAGKERPTVTLQMTFLETNLEELVGIVQLGIDLGIDRIKGHHLWAHFDEIKDLSLRRTPDSIRRWNQKAQEAIDLANTHLLPNGQKIKLENIHLLPTKPEEDLLNGDVCPFLGKEAWINTEGKFSPCCAPDKERETLGHFGHISEKTIQDIWHSDAYTHLRKTYINHPLCKKCPMKKPLEVA